MTNNTIFVYILPPFYILTAGRFARNSDKGALLE
jgi:hypothetical protein